MEKKDEYRQKLERLLNECESMIDQLEEWAKKATDHAKIELLEANPKTEKGCRTDTSR
jgi:ElaB/YqjD/DUF883 family membrane-anchored ribosome-binding protein